ncbi:hypothetical protein T07_12267 [Trichinella nelsoni]|uniref:Uncharacterized protein n=1 Tax=Trichinella nelsoni TaxID=6336 RepID=A0A0V0RJD4_9BILA|nr:hypothetical protein T07_12267 [Trichinella nelsoni]
MSSDNARLGLLAQDWAVCKADESGEQSSFPTIFGFRHGNTCAVSLSRQSEEKCSIKFPIDRLLALPQTETKLIILSTTISKCSNNLHVTSHRWRLAVHIPFRVYRNGHRSLG